LREATLQQVERQLHIIDQQLAVSGECKHWFLPSHCCCCCHLS